MISFFHNGEVIKHARLSIIYVEAYYEFEQNIIDEYNLLYIIYVYEFEQSIIDEYNLLKYKRKIF